MPQPAKDLLKFLSFVVALNLVRYFAGYPVEKFFIFDSLVGAMEKSAYCFNTHFTTFDWVTSYFYNFMMWLTVAWVYVKLQRVLTCSDVIKSLKVYGIMYLYFASLSGIYMNHYRHPKTFYFFNVLDGLLVFPIVAVANGLIYPLLFKEGSGRD